MTEHDLAVPEGPPPGTRVMAILRWILIAVMAVVAAASLAYSLGFFASDHASAAATRYYCPMHPQIVQDGPGECPICGMTLVPQESGAAPAKKREPEKISHEGHRHEPSDPYLCPMHPEETSTDPAARCPVCKMKLVPRSSLPESDAGAPSGLAPTADAGVDAASAAGTLPSGVPGLVPLELSLDRVQLIGIRTATATVDALVGELRTVGFVTADEARLARIHTRFSGWIERLAVATTGEKVKRGQVLAGIYNLELLPAQQEFLAARRFGAGGSSSALHPTISLEEDARARLELFGMSRAEIEHVARTGKPVRTVSVTSPIAGYVTRKNAVQGTYVQPGSELFEIADLSKVWVLADVYEHEIGRVESGQPAEISVAAHPERRFAGKVGFVYPTLDPGTRTLRVRVELANPDMLLRPGMYGDVVLKLAPGRGVVVPSEALVDTGEHQYVFLAKEAGRFEPRRVRAGAREAGRVVILEGLSAGETVVTTANFLLDSESRLRAAVEGKATGDAASHGAH